MAPMVIRKEMVAEAAGLVEIAILLLLVETVVMVVYLLAVVAAAQILKLALVVARVGVVAMAWFVFILGNTV